MLFGAYLMETNNDGVIVAGTIILLLAVVAWIFAALIMTGDLIRKLLISRGSKPRKSPAAVATTTKRAINTISAASTPAPKCRASAVEGYPVTWLRT